MTDWQQSGSHHLGFVSDVSKARPLPRGLGLVIGAVVSLGLWAVLVGGVLRLIG